MTTVDFYLCKIRSAYSFCTVLDASEICLGYVGLKNCSLQDLQDGLKVVINHESKISTLVHDCRFDMTRFSQDAPSHAFTITGGTAEVENCSIVFDNFDSVGLSLHSLGVAKIDGVRVATPNSASRAMAIGEGVVLSENTKQLVNDVEIVGMRVGKN